MYRTSLGANGAVLAAAASIAAVAAVGQRSADDRRPPPATPGQAMIVGEGRFDGPETALWDERADVYLVSNVAGRLTERNGNGFISRVGPDGEILALKWIDGAAPGTVLHAPRGMAFSGDELLVADIGALRVFDRATGAPLRTYAVPDAPLAQDVALDPAGGAVLGLAGREADVLVDGVATPTQIGYDARRRVLLVPAPNDDALVIYPLLDGEGES